MFLDLYLCLTNDNSRQRKCPRCKLKKKHRIFCTIFGQNQRPSGRGWKVKRQFGKFPKNHPWCKKDTYLIQRFVFQYSCLQNRNPGHNAQYLWDNIFFLNHYILIGGLQSSVGVPLLVFFYNFPAEASAIRSNWSLHTRPLSLLIFPIWLLLLLPSTAGADNTENIDSWVKMTSWKG